MKDVSGFEGHVVLLFRSSLFTEGYESEVGPVPTENSIRPVLRDEND